jgi:tRNA uridine 5-carboxymethylaminomethyl modification enzyme
MNNTINHYDVIIIGAGHAGIEAAAAAGRMGVRVGLITIKSENIGHMPCNPAIGGIGKGHIVFEIAALGGVMPELCSTSYLQSNMLNMSKGPAVQGLRLQIDKEEYKKQAFAKMTSYPNVSIIYDKIISLLVENNTIKGVSSANGTLYTATSIIITSGTFLNGLIHMGLTRIDGGRYKEENTQGLSDEIRKLGITLGRLKTGTPARLLENSINFDIMEEQKSHKLDSLFQYHNETVVHKKSCFITYTNTNTHSIILDNAHLSPIYRGDIEGISPRYCPSIEDKIKRFAHKEAHHIFVEPEGYISQEWYPNGLSTSLPIEIQEKFLRTIKGFEEIIITKPGYAIEYDFVHPNQLKHSLESKNIHGLFFAGQINGTTGYEEAAGQGIIAGINAAAKVKNIAPLILSRNESYIGIMIDDLITLGVDEPYRMFTSRAERRLLLRQDNTFFRLSKYANHYGLISPNLYHQIQEEYQKACDIILNLTPHLSKINTLLSNGNHDQVREIIHQQDSSLPSRVKEYILAEILYKPYYQRELLEIKKMEEHQNLKIDDSFSYHSIPGLSIELQQKLTKFKPGSIAQASLIQGMTPAAISLLIFKIRELQK